MAHNPYHTTAGSYQNKLDLPVIRRFRSAEKRVLLSHFSQLIKPSDSVLELGCGDGYYTRELIGRCKELTALDGSKAMLEILCNSLDRKDLVRVTCIQEDVMRFTPDKCYDVVVSVGLMDYLPNWQQFLETVFSSAARTVIITCPALSLPGMAFKVSALVEKSSIQTLSRRRLAAYLKRSFPKWDATIERVGLNGGVTGGLTLVVVANKKV